MISSTDVVEVDTPQFSSLISLLFFVFWVIVFKLSVRAWWTVGYNGVVSHSTSR